MANETIIREGLIVKGPTVLIGDTIITGSLYLTGIIYNTQLSAIQSFTQSYYIDSQSFDSRIKNTNAQYLTTESFNNFTQSYYVDSQSFDERIDQKLDSSSFNQYTQSNNTNIFNLNIVSSSFNNFTESYYQDSSSFDNRTINIISNFNSFTQSYYTDSSSFNERVNEKLNTSSFNSYTQSNDIKIDNLNIHSQSINIFTQSYYQDSSSFDIRIHSASAFENILNISSSLPYQRLIYDSGSGKYINSYKQRTTVFLTYADSPYTITEPKCLKVDTTDGAVELLFPEATLQNVGADINVFKISNDANEIICTPYAGQYLHGHDQQIIYKPFEGVTFISDYNQWGIYIERRTNLQTITVKSIGGTQGDFDTIEDAINFVNSGSVAPTLIRLYSGIHQPANKITISSGFPITLMGDGVTTTIIQPSSSLIGQSLFDIQSEISFQRFTIDCIDGYGEDINEAIFKYNGSPLNLFYSEIKDVITTNAAVAVDCKTGNELWVFDTNFEDCKYYCLDVASSSYIGISESDISLREDGIAINLIEYAAVETWDVGISNTSDELLGTSSYQQDNSSLIHHAGTIISDIGNGPIIRGDSNFLCQTSDLLNIANYQYVADDNTTIEFVHCVFEDSINHFVNTSSVKYSNSSFDQNQSSYIIETENPKSNKIFTQIRHDISSSLLPTIGFSTDLLLGLEKFYSFDYTTRTEGSASITVRNFEGNAYFNVIGHKANSRLMTNYVYAPSTSSLYGYWIWSNGQNENKDYVIQNHNRLPVFTVHSGSWQIEFGLSGSSYLFPTASADEGNILMLNNSNELIWSNNIITTESFNQFTQSYYVDSASFYNKTENIAYTTSSNIFTADQTITGSLNITGNYNGVNLITSGGGDKVLTDNGAYQKSFLSASIPLNSTSPGVEGQIAYSNNRIYICIAPNTWRRANLNVF